MEMNTLVVLFQKKSLQALFNDKVKCLVEELLHVDESGRLVVILLHVAIATSLFLQIFPKHAAYIAPFIISVNVFVLWVCSTWNLNLNFTD